MKWWVVLIIVVLLVLPVFIGLLGPESALGMWLFEAFLVLIVLVVVIVPLYLILKKRSDGKEG